MNRTVGKTKMSRPKNSVEAGQPKSVNAGSAASVAGVISGRSVRGLIPANDVALLAASGGKARRGRKTPPSQPTVPTDGPLALDGDVEIPEVLEAEVGELPVAAADSDAEDTTDEVTVESDADEADEEQIDAKRGDDEPASFLGMYFRDMAELDVLRPEQEFETARRIEEQELDLWTTILGFAPGTTWIADAIEKAAGESLADVSTYRAAGEHSFRRKASIPERNRLEKEIQQTAHNLRKLDIDRIFADGAVGEIQKLGRSAENREPVVGIGFATNTKAFRDYVKSVALKATGLKFSKNEFVKANLRLVVSIARRFNHGRLPLADLIQEGNIGLMKAVERYDYRRGFRLSTYASWWIRHAISRALADKGRAVRLPVHMIDAYHRIAKSQRELQAKLDRPPTTEEIAAATGIELEKLEKMKTFLAESPVSLDRPISDGDGRRLIDVLVDPEAEPNVPEQMATSETQTEMLRLLEGLRPIEADILRKRFGLETDKERTLKEIGDEYRLSRERVRQLQEQALGKMRRAMTKRETV